MAETDEIFEVECIMIPLEDGTDLECAILDSFEMEETGYLVLAPVEGDTIGDDRYLYRYEDTEEDIILGYIDDDDELRRAAEFYDSLDDEED